MLSVPSFVPEQIQLARQDTAVHKTWGARVDVAILGIRTSAFTVGQSATCCCFTFFFWEGGAFSFPRCRKERVQTGQKGVAWPAFVWRRQTGERRILLRRACVVAEEERPSASRQEWRLLLLKGSWMKAFWILFKTSRQRGRDVGAMHPGGHVASYF